MLDNPMMLVFNCGSSSIKFAWLNAATGERQLAGVVERIGADDSSMSVTVAGEKQQLTLGQVDYAQAFAAIFDVITKQGLDHAQLLAVCHRVVHGGTLFSHTTRISDDALEELRTLSHLAPLHNPANIAGIDFVRAKLPNISQFMTFDTAFHSSMPAENHLYALPIEYYQKHHVRKYGFHGTSHAFVSQQAVNFLNLKKDNHGIVSCHLGNGCSLCAVENGRSMDTTMGLTPLDGLMMGTRSGSIDPSIHAFLQHELGLDLEQIMHILNKESGLLGVSGLSNDMRDLETAAADGHQQAQLALAMFVLSITQYLYAMVATLARFDAVIFTGGIGENSSYTRERVIARCKHLGLALNAEANNQRSDEALRNIADDASIPVLVVATDEEWQMAREAQQQLL